MKRIHISKNLRAIVFLLISLSTLSSLLATVVPKATPTAGAETTSSSRVAPLAAAEKSGFGPAIFLLRLPDGTLPGILPPTVIVHTLLDAEQGLFVASGGIADVQAAGDAGIDALVVDSESEGRRYYLVDGESPRAHDLASSGGDVLYTGDHTLLVGVARAGEQALVETLTTQGIQISLVSDRALRFEKTDAIHAAAFDHISEVNPFIAGLLTELNTTDLASIIAELSGESVVNIGGLPVTIETRYTFSSDIEDAERYLFQAYGQMGIEAKTLDWTYGSYSGRNIVADLKGKLYPERVWLIGGHFDSNSEDPYNRAPGADDNASGSAATLLIAEILNQVDLADTVRFVHFSGEEQGQWGSKRYVPTLAAGDEEIMGYINIDMIGWDGNGDRVAELHTGTGNGSNALGTAIIEAGDVYGLGLSFERKTTSASRFSDHSPFWDGGHPAVLAIENFYSDDIPADHSPWYHSTGDTLERVDLDYVLAYARTALATIAELAGAAEKIDAPVPTPTPESATATPTATAQPIGCVDLIANGGWEDEGGWRYGTTPFSARPISVPVHAGARALQQGIPSGSANRLAHSSTFQEVTIPDDADTVELRYWVRPGGAGDGIDFREVRLLTPSYGNLAQIKRDVTTGDNQWFEESFDLSTYAGHTVVLYFNVYNDGLGSQIWTFVDDVALLACNGSSSTVTPTLTPMATDTLIPTAMPTATVVPTSTPKSTSTATATSTPRSTPRSTPTVTPTVTPTATTTASGTSTPENVERIYMPMLREDVDIQPQPDPAHR